MWNNSLLTFNGVYTPNSRTFLILPEQSYYYMFITNNYAEFRHRGNKVFLKCPGLNKFTEVELLNIHGGLRVVVKAKRLL